MGKFGKGISLFVEIAIIAILLLLLATYWTILSYYSLKTLSYKKNSCHTAKVAFFVNKTTRNYKKKECF